MCAIRHRTVPVDVLEGHAWLRRRRPEVLAARGRDNPSSALLTDVVGG